MSAADDYRELVARARAGDDVLGLILTGSRGRGPFAVVARTAHLAADFLSGSATPPRVALAGLAVLLVAGCGGGASPPKTQIVRWKSIGTAALGDTRSEIRHAFGKPFGSSRIDQTQLAGTKYAGRQITSEAYRVPGHQGLLYVRYLDGVAKELGTDSARYSTDDGIRVGKTITRGPCLGKGPGQGNCTYRWRGFEFDDCTNDFVLSRRNLVVEIGLDRSLFRHRSGHVIWIGFGDPDVVLHCF